MGSLIGRWCRAMPRPREPVDRRATLPAARLKTARSSSEGPAASATCHTGRSGSPFAAARRGTWALTGPWVAWVFYSGRLAPRSDPFAKRGRRGLEVARGGKGCVIRLMAILDWPRGRPGRRRFLLLVVTGDNAGARNLDFEGTLEQPDAL
jgi:hypothetical protein